MKKIIYVGLFALLLVLAACAQPPAAQDDQQDDNMQDESPATQEPENEAPPAPEEQEPEEPVISIDAKTQALIDTADSKVTSFSFVYVGPPENLPTDEYFVKGDTIAVELAKATDVKLSQPYSHVYLDTESETAVAYCAAEDQTWCPNGTVRHGTVAYEKHYVRTPYQWLKDIRTAEHKGNGPQFEQRSTARIAFTTMEGVSGEMYVVEFYGLPGKITLDNGETIEFRDLAINSVTDARVTPPEV